MLKKNLIYEPPIKLIKNEKDVLKLLNDVGINLHLIGLHAAEASLERFLEIIEFGEYDNKKNGEIFYDSVDLSKAQSLIRDYREKSTSKGCKSCEHSKIYKPSTSEEMKYCNLHEIPENIERNSNAPDYDSSPRINKLYWKGCEDKKPIFTKTIEEIIKENPKS